MQNSDRLRCSDWERKRGQRSLVHPTEATVPSTTVADSRMSDTRPVARVRYHRALEPWPTVAITLVITGCLTRAEAGGVRDGPALGVDNSPVEPHKPRRKLTTLQPADGA